MLCCMDKPCPSNPPVLCNTGVRPTPTVLAQCIPQNTTLTTTLAAEDQLAYEDTKFNYALYINSTMLVLSHTNVVE